MKKRIAIMLSCIMCVCMAACGNSSGNTTTTAAGKDASGAKTESAKESGKKEAESLKESKDKTEAGKSKTEGKESETEKKDSASSGKTSSDGPSMTLSLGTTSAAEDIQTLALEKFAESVKERTGGKITVNVFPASQLGDAVSEMESMIAGSQDMFMEGELSYMHNYGIDETACESFAVAATPEAIKNLCESSVMEEMREKFREKNGLVTIGYNFYRPPIVMATKKELKAIEDFEGVKLRVVPSESTIASYSALGFNPTSVAYNEVYLSLSQGVIDGTIAPLDAMFTMKFYEQAPYILKLGCSVTNVALWMNEKKFNELSDDQKEIFSECAKEAGDWYTEESNSRINERVSEMEKAGCTVAEASDELWDECFKRWKGVAEQYEKDGLIPEGTYDKFFKAAHPDE